MIIALLGAICGLVAWLIVGGLHGWSRGDKIAVVGIVVAAGAAFAAVIGPPLFERWLDRRPPHAPPRVDEGPVPEARKKGVLDERKQDKQAVVEALRDDKDRIFPERDV